MSVCCILEYLDGGSGNAGNFDARLLCPLVIIIFGWVLVCVKKVDLRFNVDKGVVSIAMIVYWKIFVPFNKLRMDVILLEINFFGCRFGVHYL